MDARSILVGKVYRTAEGEMRRVTARDGDRVTFTSVMGPPGPGMVLRTPAQHLSIEDFCKDAESEVAPGTL